MEPKGLTNPKGANNCWLNATVQEKSAIFFKLEKQIFNNRIHNFSILLQLLWHLDVFRDSIQKLSGFGHYRCQQERCVYCHVRSLMNQYKYRNGQNFDE